jgi:hypothetical protein
MHLPRDEMDDWLKSQMPKAARVEGHRNPPRNIFEVWTEWRVAVLLKPGAKAKKAKVGLAA